MGPQQTLSELVAINSIFPNEQRLAQYLEQRLQELGFSTRRISVSQNRFNVVAQRGTAGEPILFYAHMDTVPIYGEWSSDPHTLHEDGDKLFGLGAYDMKAGIAAILHAVDIPTNQRIKIAFAVDEENDSAGGFAILNDGFFNDCKIAIVPEINDSTTQTEQPNAIMLGRRGRAVYQFQIHGIGAHGAHIKDGVSAIDEACTLSQQLANMNNEFQVDGFVPAQSQFTRKISSENTSLSLPESATIEVDRHITAPDNSQSILEQFNQKLIELYQNNTLNNSTQKVSVSIKPRETPYLEPYQTSKENDSIQLLSKIISQKIAPAIYTYGLSTADECVVALAKIPVLSYGPVGANPHKPNEWVSKKSLIQMIDVLQIFINSQ